MRGLMLFVGVLSLSAEAAELNPTTGLVNATGHDLVAAHCSACHSTKLISQNRMDREKWIETIRWMQRTQNLWDLGAAETVILDYLETYYTPTVSGRRPPIPEHLMPPKT